MSVGEDSIQYRKRKKHVFLVAAVLFFIGKIISILIASLTWLEAPFLYVTSCERSNCSF